MGVGVCVAVGKGVGVVSGMGVNIGVGLGSDVTVGDGVAVGLGVGIGVAEGSGAGVGASVGAGVGVSVAVAVGTAVGVVVCMGLGSEVGVLSARRTSGTGDATCPASRSCPQANAVAASAKEAIIPSGQGKESKLLPHLWCPPVASAEASSHLSSNSAISNSGKPAARCSLNSS